MKELSEKEKEIISEAKMKYKLGARRLEKVTEQVYGVHIPHKRIHKYLLDINCSSIVSILKTPDKIHFRF